MDIPADVQTHEMPNSIIWIKEGIVYSTPKINTSHEINSEQMKRDMNKFRAIVGPEKVCMVVEINSKSRPAAKNDRDAVASEVNKIAKAMAIITTSPFTKMLANLFFGFKPPPYPTKMFLHEKDATNWIKQYV
jgi:hypothetical protein